MKHNLEYDVFFFEVFNEEKEELLSILPKQINIGFTEKTIQEFGNGGLLSENICIRTQSKIPNEWIPYLKSVLTRSTGFDHVTYLKKYNHLEIGYLPLYCTRSVAEHAFLLIFCLLKKIKKQMSNFEIFDRNGITGCELLNKNLLVVGVGNIGYEIYKIGKNFGLNVKGVDIKKNKDVDYIDVEDGLQWADIIVCSMNLTEENYNYFNENMFLKTTRNPFFINISRGEFSFSTTLLKMIEKGILSGVGLDVFNKESIMSCSLRNRENNDDLEFQNLLKLYNNEKCILTPHNAFNSIESTLRKSEQTSEQLFFYFKNKTFKWNV